MLLALNGIRRESNLSSLDSRLEKPSFGEIIYSVLSLTTDGFGRATNIGSKIKKFLLGGCHRA